MFELISWHVKEIFSHFTFLMQMGDGKEANKEFMEQLRLQELYGQTNEDGSNPFTYTDPEDGTVYDWDHEKKAWFPKVGPPLHFPALMFLCLHQ